MWRGIRFRVAVLAALVVVVVLVGAAFALVTTQRRLLNDNLDETLANNAADVQRDDPSGTLEPRGDEDSIVQIVAADGTVIGATANYESRPALAAPPGGATRRTRTDHLLDGEPAYRILSIRADGLVIHVASPVDDIEESVSTLRLALGVTIPVLALILAVLIWWLLGRILRPVEAIRREVSTISGQNLHRRVPEPASRDEIDRLARTMNAMLDRVEHSAISQKRFIADVSHELRSPLTRIRSELEIDLAHPSTADLSATHRSVLDETEQMQQLVDDLLVLARHDANGAATPRRRDAVDLDDIVFQEVQRSATPSVHVDTTAVSAAQVEGDRDQLARVVRNVLGNAVRYASAAVVITLGESADGIRLTVTDDGPGIAPEHHELIFERFTRLDGARTRDEGGAGLGLAIARSIVEQHGGTLRLDTLHPTGARFVVQMPSTARSPG